MQYDSMTPDSLRCSISPYDEINSTLLPIWRLFFANKSLFPVDFQLFINNNSLVSAILALRPIANCSKQMESRHQNIYAKSE